MSVCNEGFIVRKVVRRAEEKKKYSPVPKRSQVPEVDEVKGREGTGKGATYERLCLHILQITPRSPFSIK